MTALPASENRCPFLEAGDGNPALGKIETQWCGLARVCTCFYAPYSPLSLPPRTPHLNLGAVSPVFFLLQAWPEAAAVARDGGGPEQRPRGWAAVPGGAEQPWLDVGLRHLAVTRLRAEVCSSLQEEPRRTTSPAWSRRCCSWLVAHGDESHAHGDR